VLGRITPKTLTGYTQQPGIIELAKKQPDEWVAVSPSAQNGK